MIKVIRCCLLTALQEIKTWTENWRMAMLLLLMFVTVAEFCNNINDFSSRMKLQMRSRYYLICTIINILDWLYSLGLF